MNAGRWKKGQENAMELCAKCRKANEELQIIGEDRIRKVGSFHVRQSTVQYSYMPYSLKKQPKRLRKIERIEARLNSEQKRRIEYAASLKGTSISDFMVSSADDAAMATIQQHEIWILNRQDSEIVVEALLHPRPPNAHMKTAVARYRRLVKTS